MWALSAFQNLLVCWTEPVNQQKYQALREERKITTVTSHRLTVSAPPCPFQKDLCDCIQGAFLLPRPLQRGPRWEERESVQRNSQGPPRGWMSFERGVFCFACNHRGSPKSTEKVKRPPNDRVPCMRGHAHRCMHSMQSAGSARPLSDTWLGTLKRPQK